MPITAFYAALLAPLFVYLSLRVIYLRNSTQTNFGDGGNPELRRCVRVHGNFAEYCPFGLLLLGLAESVQTPQWLLHVGGIALVAGRLVHAVGVSRADEPMALRVAGMALTFTMLIGMALACLIEVASRF